MRVDRILGLVLLFVALVWLWLAFTYIPGARGAGETGPRAFPVLLGMVLAGLGVALALNPGPAGEAVAQAVVVHDELGVIAVVVPKSQGQPAGDLPLDNRRGLPAGVPITLQQLIGVGGGVGIVLTEIPVRNGPAFAVCRSMCLKR